MRFPFPEREAGVQIRDESSRQVGTQYVQRKNSAVVTDFMGVFADLTQSAESAVVTVSASRLAK
jgi:hypothetical protein